MKVRSDFVTNSSSSSFICCFARIADPEKAKSVLESHGDIAVYTAEEVLSEISGSRWSKWLEWDWANIDVTPSENYIKDHMDDKFIVIQHYEDLCEDEYGEVDYDVGYEDFDTEAIDAVSEESGFADINVQYGAGRNG